MRAYIARSKWFYFDKPAATDDVCFEGLNLDLCMLFSTCITAFYNFNALFESIVLS